jgi:hypothetical protein
MRAGERRLKFFDLILPAVLEGEVAVPVIFSSVPDLDVEMPRYKGAAPFSGVPVVQKCAESDDSQVMQVGWIEAAMMLE